MFSIITILVDNGLRKTEYDNYKEWNDIFGQKINPDILIQGTSRAHVQYNTYIIDSALHVNSYNMGINGSPFDIQYLRFKACMTNKIIPKIIIQNVDWETIDRNDPPYQPEQFLPYLTDNEFKKQVALEKILPKYKTAIPFLKYSGELKVVQLGLMEALGLHHISSEKHKGYIQSPKKWNGDNFEERKNRGYAPFTINKSVEVLFNDFLLECHNRNIKVILVYSPPYYELNKLFPRQQVINYYKRIAEQYKIHFIDLSKDSISYNKANYANSTHFNQTGAEKFSRKLTEKLKPILKSYTNTPFYN